MSRLAILTIAAVFAIGGVAAEEPEHPDSQVPNEHHHHPGMEMEMAGPLGLPDTRNASGTSWQPDSTPMHAVHFMKGAWGLMAHGTFFAGYDRQNGDRGDSAWLSTNWGMLMESRSLGGGQLVLRQMLSLEPLTVEKGGYPLLLQTGESVDGEPIHDRQHPHDLFMEIAALYARPVGESLAWQVFYPDMFNGTWTFCPDPVDFRYFQMVNIYQDKNAFYPNSPWKTEAVRPWQRTPDDQVLMSEKDASHLEEVLGTRGRSGDQMDVFNATFGPVGSDGYPKLLYDKWTGVIDPSVAQYWKEHYDLNAIMQRDWKTLGPKLRGKLHLYVGEMDSYYLEEAAFLLKDFLDKADPPAEAAWDIGERAPHCYAGKPEYPGQRAEQRILPQMMDRALKTAPAGADLKSWRY